MLAASAGKFIAILLFLILSVSITSGFLVAEQSLSVKYDSSFEEYNIEDGHFELLRKMPKSLVKALGKEEITIFPLFNKDIEIKKDCTLRVYPVREEINRLALLEGALPENDEELVLERLFAGNNGYVVSSELTLGGKVFRVCGLVAFSDYSCLFKNNTDGMFDNTHFGVACVRQKAFEELKYNDFHYTYAWKNHNPDLSPREKNDLADHILDLVKKHALIKDFVRQSDNQAIRFAGEDFGNDRIAMLVFFYILVLIIAFVYAIVMRSTLELEAKSIGSLRALGYTKKELILHYSLLPLLATFLGALLGNILGYTILKDYFVHIYTKSYSLIPGPVLWNAKAFLLTTVGPIILVLLIIYGYLASSLALPIQKFLRHDLSRRKQKHAVHLGKLSFISRFRLRIIIQNTSTYLLLLLGILLGSLLMNFSLILPPSLDHHREEVMANQISAYQYILRLPVEIEDEGAEKFAALGLELEDSKVMIFGLEEDSRFLPEVSRELESEKAIFSHGLVSKFGLKKGDLVELSKKYTDETYRFELGGSYYYPATFTIFVSLDDFRTIFDCSKEYFTGYLSDHELESLKDIFIAAVRTEGDWILSLNQILDSMGQFFKLMAAFAVILFFVLIYVLSKQVVERNQKSIAMLKILGYEDKEINNLYHVTTGLVLVFSFLISLPICYFLVKLILRLIVTQYLGWIEFYTASWIYPLIVVSGLASYTLIYVMQSGKTRDLSLAEVFKGME